MLKKFLAVHLLVFLCNLSAQQHPEPLPFALFTIPKSGSHLMIKALYFMTGLTPHWHLEPLSIQETLHHRHFPYTHCCLSSELLRFYDASFTQRILGIRDLRDVCVSIVYQMRKGIWPEFTGYPNKTKAFNHLSFDEQLLFVIQQNYQLAPPGIKQHLEIQKVAKQAADLVKNPQILVCRYEDIVGPQGGGTIEKQLQTLEKIARHINAPLSALEVEAIASRLYGDEENPFGQGNFQHYQTTFRQGKIGGWRAAFKPIHKAAFKEKLGAHLIALGYEQDDNW
ncbi:MAG: hypothetical protein WCF19_04830 [Chlamydiales bacterium]